MFRSDLQGKYLSIILILAGQTMLISLNRPLCAKYVLSDSSELENLPWEFFSFLKLYEFAISVKLPSKFLKDLDVGLKRNLSPSSWSNNSKFELFRSPIREFFPVMQKNVPFPRFGCWEVNLACALFWAGITDWSSEHATTTGISRYPSFVNFPFSFALIYEKNDVLEFI